MTYQFTLKDFLQDCELHSIHEKDYNGLSTFTSFVQSTSDFNDIKRTTKQDLLKLLSVDGMQLKKVHPADQTDEICMTAVKQNGLALQFVINQTHPIVVAALEQNGDAWTYVASEYQTPSLAKISFNNGNTHFKSIMAKYGKKLSDAWDGRSLRNLSASARMDWKTCLAAVIENPLEIDNVQTEANEFWGSVILLYRFCLGKIKIQSMTTVLVAVNASGLALEYVSTQLRTYEVCAAAIKQNPLAIKFVPSTLISSENVPGLMEQAVRGNPLVLSQLPTNARSTMLCRITIAETGFIHYALSNPDVIKELSREYIYQIILNKLSGSKSDKIKQVCQGSYSAETKTRLLACLL